MFDDLVWRTYSVDTTDSDNVFLGKWGIFLEYKKWNLGYKQICSITHRCKKSQKLNKRVRESLIVLFEFCVVSNFVSYMLKMLSSFVLGGNLSPFFFVLGSPPMFCTHEDSPFFKRTFLHVQSITPLFFYLNDLCHSNPRTCKDDFIKTSPYNPI